MKLTGFELPLCSIYTIDSNLGNNFFHINGFNITIENGNYNIEDMVATLNNEISKVSELSGKVSVSYKKNMCKLVITFTEPSGMLEFNKDISICLTLTSIY